jgi:hypothetical protein
MSKKTNTPAAVKSGLPYRTTDYARFTLIKENRVVDTKHVEKLKAAITKSDLLHAYPIIVCEQNGKLLVLDGQHRLRAAQDLKRPIYYVVSPSMTPDDIAATNTLPRGWKLPDYARYFAAKTTDYQYTLDFAAEHRINLSDAMNLLAAHDGGIGGGGGAAVAWKAGAWLITTRAHAQRAVEELARWRDYTRMHANKRHFLVALSRAIAMDFYNETDVERAMKHGWVPAERDDAEGYFEELIKCHNYRARKPVIVHGKKVYKGN